MWLTMIIIKWLTMTTLLKLLSYTITELRDRLYA